MNITFIIADFKYLFIPFDIFNQITNVCNIIVQLYTFFDQIMLLFLHFMENKLNYKTNHPAYIHYLEIGIDEFIFGKY